MLLKDFPLIFAIIRNSRKTSINREMLGHSIKRKIGPVTQEDILSYVDATLDDPSRYADSGCPAPPFYISRLLYPMFRYYMINRKLGINLLRMVHGQQTAHWMENIHEGDILDVEMTVHDIESSAAGETITLRTTVYSGGRLLNMGDTIFLVKGREKVKGGNPSKQQDTPAREIFRRTISTQENQPLKYAKVSGDGNFIHTSNFLARLVGLPRTIMHGVCIAAMAANGLLDEVLAGDMSRMKSISMRFANPVLPGEAITIVGYDSGEKNRIHFAAFNSRGKPVLKNGEYIFS